MPTVRAVTDPPKSYRHRMTIGAHELFTDLSVAEGGEDSAPGAHEYFDASLAACKALTALWYAKRNAIPVERVDVDVDRDASEERNGRYKLSVRIAYHGPLTDEQRTRVH